MVNDYIEEQTGYGGVRLDDGMSAESAVDHLLYARIARDWMKPARPVDCSACGGSSLTLDEAIMRLKARDAAKAADALIAAVEYGGMPKANAYSLAAKHFANDAGVEARIDKATKGTKGTKGSAPCKNCGET